MEIAQLHELFLQSKGITTDTRSIKRDQLFFALKGENFNGNKFAAQAIEKGAAYSIIDEEEYADGNDQIILFKDVLDTLQKLANFHRRYLKLPILAITGSNGKTTSKELIHAVLKRKFETVATVGNLNNHIGVPLTLLSMKTSTEFGIVEMGANHPKEIAHLCEIAEPDYGYITNFGKAHLEGFGSLEGVVKAKSELYDFLKANDKLLFINSDDKIQAKQTQTERTYTFGTTPQADLQIKYIENNKVAAIKADGINFTSNLTGSYNAINIAAAVCIGKFFKVATESVQKAIIYYKPSNNRSQIVHIGTSTLIMDAYNANPTSMAAALESFKNHPAKHKAVILGDMFELGTTSQEEHQQIIELLRSFNFEKNLVVGKNFFQTRTEDSNIRKFEFFEDLADFIRSEDLHEMHILVKGSRGMALERIVEVLKNRK